MKTIKEIDINNKKVIIRVDFNVPIKEGIIEDDTRIKESLETIKYAISNNAKLILLSHLGRIKSEKEKINNSLEPVCIRLSELLNQKVVFVPYTRGKELENAINGLKCGEVLLVENTRFEDIYDNKESKNDTELAKYWASLGELFINDAFGMCHRKHASNFGIAKYLESGIGFLIEKELNNLLPAINNPKRPFTVILGGSKVSDKIGVIKNLVNIADYILIGGAMAFTFLKSQEIEVGSSILDLESIDFCKDVLKKYSNKIILPIDVVTTDRECFITDMKRDDQGFDIGSQTVDLFEQYLKNSSTIIWNGPVGMFENEKYAKGTKLLCDILKKIDAIKIVGGGDTVNAIKKYSDGSDFTYISTGGGATLKLLEGEELPALEVIK